MTPKLVAGTALLAALAASPASGEGRARLADCRIESGGKVELSGKCRFIPGECGTFTLGNADRGKPLYGDVLMLTVAIVAPDNAEVRGLTNGGISSRWGAAKRSARDRACWDGADFRICAR